MKTGQASIQAHPKTNFISAMMISVAIDSDNSIEIKSAKQPQPAPI